MSDRLLPFDAALMRLKALHPKSIDLSLGRMERLCAALGDPQTRLPPVVHVAGTNGKGSTLALLRAMAEAAGLKVHVYTSPHLVRFAERIRLAGTLIDETHLSAVLDRVEAANAGNPITFFEVTTAAAFLAFSETPADLLLLETGLGGRLDATNLVPHPRLCAITPVDLDHTEFLGPDIATIAGEKAGIIKRGAEVILGAHHPDAEAVLVRAAERCGIRPSLMGQDYDAAFEDGRLVWRDETRLLDLPLPALYGAHQAQNAGLAIACALRLGFSETAIAEGLKTAVWPARMQRLTQGPLALEAAKIGADLWLDGGHNPHAAAALAQTFSQSNDRRPIDLICGMMGNKDASAFFGHLAPQVRRVVCVPFDSVNATPPEVLADCVRRFGLDADVAPDVPTALSTLGRAHTETAAGDTQPPRILICGSLYLAGEVLALSPDTWPR